MCPTTAVVSQHRLTAITEISEVQELRDLYRRDWPAHCVGYYCVDNFLRWLQRAASEKVDLRNLHIYTCNGDWRRHQGLVLIVDRYQLFVQCMSLDQEDILITALTQLNWDGGLKVSSLAERHREPVMQLVHSKNLNLEYDSLTLMYYMPRKQALELEVECPPNFIVRPLTVADAVEIDALWPNQHRGSLFLIKRLIEWNINMGAYTADTGELVAWCLRLQGGFLGALQVKESHKRLGLGTLVTRATSRRIAESGDDIMALVNPENAPSRGMFDKLGFTVTDRCYWLRTLPTKDGLEWPEGE